MGYLIEPGGGALVKIETLISAVRMQTLSTNPQTIKTKKAGFVFMPVAAFIQVNGTSSYNTFLHLWLWQQGGAEKAATFGRAGANELEPGKASAFIVNIDHGTLPTNQFGVTIEGNRDFVLEMDQDDSSGDGDGFVTIYGYYLPEFI
jgi:hypothetical protein